MKKLYFLLFFIAPQNYGQSIEAIYISSQIKSFGATTEDISKSIQPRTFAYSYSNKKSRYELIPAQKSSNDTSHIEKYGQKLETYNEIRLPTIDITFKDLESGTLQKEYTIGEKDFSAKEKLTDYEWKFESETSAINGYTCKKATSSNSLAPITAWYCEEIHVNDGPSTFWGLPGLILKVELGGYSTITLEKIKISPKNIIVEEPVNKSRPVSLRELYRNAKIYSDSISPVTKYKSNNIE